eukprot:5077235-Amphidinium_carterae.1
MCIVYLSILVPTLLCVLPAGQSSWCVGGALAESVHRLAAMPNDAFLVHHAVSKCLLVELVMLLHQDYVCLLVTLSDAPPPVQHRSDVHILTWREPRN